MMNNTWNRTVINMPPEGVRVLVSNGEIVTVARYVLSDNHINWIYDCEQYRDIEVLFWMDMPELPPKINSISANVTE